MFEPPPTDENALADNLGLMLNCINSALYMVRSAARLRGSWQTQSASLMSCLHGCLLIRFLLR